MADVIELYPRLIFGKTALDEGTSHLRRCVPIRKERQPPNKGRVSIQDCSRTPLSSPARGRFSADRVWKSITILPTAGLTIGRVGSSLELS